MDGLAYPFNGALKRRWRKRQYRRLDNSAPNRRKAKTSAFGGRPRRFWRVKVVPKLQLKIASPSKLWSKLKNAYINMMMSLAGNVSSLNNGDVFRGKRVAGARRISVTYTDKEFENRMIYEIFKSLMASKELGAQVRLGVD
ncbi:hypothetical protein NMG60_11006154 [Bertholletia excelsa]